MGQHTGRPAGRRLPTRAFHATDGSKHVVGVKDLHVMLLKDGKGWFAQGIEIDYAAGGESLDEAKKNFEDGLAMTIKEHLARHGTIDKLLTPAPPASWKEFYDSPMDAKALYSTVQAYEILKRAISEDAARKLPFPFGAVRFIKAEPVPA